MSDWRFWYLDRVNCGLGRLAERPSGHRSCQPLIPQSSSGLTQGTQPPELRRQNPTDGFLKCHFSQEHVDRDCKGSFSSYQVPHETNYLVSLDSRSDWKFPQSLSAEICLLQRLFPPFYVAPSIYVLKFRLNNPTGSYNVFKQCACRDQFCRDVRRLYKTDYYLPSVSFFPCLTKRRGRSILLVNLAWPHAHFCSTCCKRWVWIWTLGERNGDGVSTAAFAAQTSLWIL